MSRMYVKRKHLDARVRERGPAYALALAAAIDEEGPEYVVVNTAHPAYLDLVAKYAPPRKEIPGETPEARATRLANLAKQKAAAESALIQRYHELWDAIHTLEDPTPEKLDRIVALIPCGECETHFVELLKELPPVYDSLAGYRYRSWEWHNAVNSHLSKPPFPYADAAAKYGWPTPEA